MSVLRTLFSVGCCLALCYGFHITATPQDIYYSLTEHERPGYFSILDWEDPTTKVSVKEYLRAPDFSDHESLWRFGFEKEEANPIVELYSSLGDDSISKQRLLDAQIFLKSPQLRHAFKEANVDFLPTRVHGIKEIKATDDEPFNRLIKHLEEYPELIEDERTALALSRISPALYILFNFEFTDESQLELLSGLNPAIIQIQMFYSYYRSTRKSQHLFLDYVRNSSSSLPNAKPLLTCLNGAATEAHIFALWFGLFAEVRQLPDAEQAFWTAKLLSAFLRFFLVFYFTSSNPLYAMVKREIRHFFTQLPHHKVPKFLLAELAGIMRHSKCIGLFMSLRTLFSETPENLKDIPFPWLSVEEELARWKKAIIPVSHFMFPFERRFHSYKISSEYLLYWFARLTFGIKESIRYHPRLLRPWTVVLENSREVTCNTLICMLDVIEYALDTETLIFNPMNIISSPHGIACGNAPKVSVATIGYSRLFLMRLLLVDELGLKQVKPVAHKLLSMWSIRFRESFDASGARLWILESGLWQFTTKTKLKAAVNPLGIRYTPREISATLFCICFIVTILSSLIATMAMTSNT